MPEVSRRSEPMEASWDRLRLLVPKTLAADAGARPLPDGDVLRLRVVDRECDVDLSAREIRYAADPTTAVSVHLRILILHYLEGAGKAPIAGRPATFREFEGGDVYYPAFKSRAVDRIVEAFGTAPEDFRRAGEALGAEPVKAGHAGYRVDYFPKLPIVVVLWRGDEEVRPSANILFDANAGRLLPTEDLAVAAEDLVHRMTNVSKGGNVPPRDNA